MLTALRGAFCRLLMTVAGTAKQRLQFAGEDDHEQQLQEDDAIETDLARERRRFSAHMISGSSGRENQLPLGHHGNRRHSSDC